MGVAGEPFYRDLFRFSGRRRRGSYFNLMFSVGVLYFPINVLFDHSAHLLSVQIGLTLLAIPIGLVSVAVIAQRCRDVGWSGWAALFVMLPVIGVAIFLVLLFYPGTRGPNRYGPDPLEAGRPLAV